MKEPPLLRVEWVDSLFLEHRWRDTDDLPDMGLSVISVGYRMKRKDGFLFLAASWNQDEGSVHWANVIAIPERAIVKKRRIGH